MEVKLNNEQIRQLASDWYETIVENIKKGRGDENEVENFKSKRKENF